MVNLSLNGFIKYVIKSKHVGTFDVRELYAFKDYHFRKVGSFAFESHNCIMMYS